MSRPKLRSSSTCSCREVVRYFSGSLGRLWVMRLVLLGALKLAVSVVLRGPRWVVQLLCELGLFGGGPLVGVFGRGEQPERGVWSVGVVVDAPVLEEDLGLEKAVELPAVEEFVS